jgi:RNA polymerase sigma-70 factor (ECF subfamily)
MDDETFQQLLSPHLDRLYRLAWRLTGSKSNAEDLFQELLFKAFLKRDTLADVEDPASWLCRVMYNLSIDEHRRFKRQRLMTVEEGRLDGDGMAQFASDLDPEADQQRLDAIVQLDRALDMLSDEHRLTVLLHDTEGYKLEEIQEITGVPVGTVKSRLHRARARLKEILLKNGTFS